MFCEQNGSRRCCAYPRSFAKHFVLQKMMPCWTFCWTKCTQNVRWTFLHSKNVSKNTFLHQIFFCTAKCKWFARIVKYYQNTAQFFFERVMICFALQNGKLCLWPGQKQNALHFIELNWVFLLGKNKHHQHSRK